MRLRSTSRKHLFMWRDARERLGGPKKLAGRGAPARAPLAPATAARRLRPAASRARARERERERERG
eukprot:4418930-Alexandrium_andersonii.AAC.1